ncbi:heterokaryon incompatibility protein-domain-containing protein [Xylariaceae sp. AK1471]|nr:heterokaryon incompatibility protein-domain-containing protein [Xylariaceae sp. AK1471]
MGVTGPMTSSDKRPASSLKFSASVKFSLDQLDQSTQTPDSKLCSQCRALDLITPISFIERNRHTPSILVANRAGLDLECPLCQLFAKFIFPNRHKEITLSYEPWQLRLNNLRSMYVDNLTSKYFQPAIVTVLHEGSEPIDYVRYLNNEEVLRRGLLVCTKTHTLRRTILRYDRTQNVPESRFVSSQYDPRLVKTWLKTAYKHECESSEGESDDTSDECSGDWNHSVNDDSSEAESAENAPEDGGDSESESQPIAGIRYEVGQSSSNAESPDGTDSFVENDDSASSCTHVSLNESYISTDSESLPELGGLSTEEQSESGRSEINWSHSRHPNWSEEKWLMKVIDCETLNIVTQEPNIKYIALSYVWRLAETNMVDVETIHPNRPQQSGTLPSRIPRVIRDAIVVVRDIGYRWLWVDKYCIDQSNQEELQDQISKMDLIYSFADLTLIAANSSGSLPGVHNSTRIQQNILTLGGLPDGQGSSSGRFDVTIFTAPPLATLSVQESKWHARGWCYQEAILSPRRLYFTDHAMHFEAGLVSGTDLMPDTNFWNNSDEQLVQVYSSRISLSSPLSWEKRLYKSHNKLKRKGMDQDLGRFWDEFSLFQGLLEVFLTKELTIETDVLSAFQGVANIFQRRNPNFHLLQGIPILHRAAPLTEQSCKDQGEAVQYHSLVAFVFALKWYHADSTSTFVGALGRFHDHATGTNDSTCDSPQLSRRLGFPSWSWAGWRAMPTLPSEAPNLAWQPQLTFHAIETMSGKVVKWADAPLYFNQNYDDSRYLIGEASLVDIDDTLDPLAWTQFSENEKAHTISQWKATWYVSVVERMDKSKPLPEAEKLQILSKLHSGAWSCLTMYADRSSADHDYIQGGLLLVAWEDEEERYLEGHKLRTCSRIGLLTIHRHFCPDDDDRIDFFSDSYRARHRVHFRLG